MTNIFISQIKIDNLIADTKKVILSWVSIIGSEISTITGNSTKSVVYYGTSTGNSANTATAPTIQSIYPNNGLISPDSRITILAKVIPNGSPITKVEIYVDNKIKTTDYSVPYSYVWNTRKEFRGQHLVTIKAFSNNLITTNYSVVTLI